MEDDKQALEVDTIMEAVEPIAAELVAEDGHDDPHLASFFVATVTRAEELGLKFEDWMRILVEPHTAEVENNVMDGVPATFLNFSLSPMKECLEFGDPRWLNFLNIVHAEHEDFFRSGYNGQAEDNPQIEVEGEELKAIVERFCVSREARGGLAKEAVFLRSLIDVLIDDPEEGGKFYLAKRTAEDNQVGHVKEMDLFEFCVAYEDCSLGIQFVNERALQGQLAVAVQEGQVEDLCEKYAEHYKYLPISDKRH
jgi:hypothetical protein